MREGSSRSGSGSSGASRRSSSTRRDDGGSQMRGDERRAGRGREDSHSSRGGHASAGRGGRSWPLRVADVLNAPFRGLDPFARDRLLKRGIAVMLAVIAVLLVLIALTQKGCLSGSGDEEEADDSSGATLTSTAAIASIEERLAACVSWTSQSALDFLDIEDADGIYGFDLSGGNETPTLSLSSLIALAEALTPYEDAEVSYGFLIVDLETGLGFACNLDEVVYGASSFKAAFCTFAGQTYLDSGEYSLSSTIGEIDVEGAEGTTYYSATSLTELFTNAIVYSGNEAFIALRNLFSDDDLAEWLDSLGVDDSIAYDASFPHYTARAAAALWLTIYQYWQTDSDVAAFIKECCEQTEASFLRDALEDAGYDVEVWDKAGWNIDGDSTDGIDYNAICDNGIVTYNGRDYLVCVMLGAAYSESTLVNAENLMAAIFSLVEDLA